MRFLRNVNILFLFLVLSCEDVVLRPEQDRVIQTGRCNKWEMCLVTTSTGFVGWMYKPEIGDLVCEKLPAKNSDFSNFVLKCER